VPWHRRRTRPASRTTRRLVGSGLRASRHRHFGALQGRAAAGGAARGGGRLGLRGILDRHLDHGLDRPSDRSRLLQGSGLPDRARARGSERLLRLRRLPDRSLRRRPGRQRLDLARRQRVRLQGGAQPAPRGRPFPPRLREDLRRSAQRHPGRARSTRQIRSPAARLHHRAEARPLRQRITAGRSTRRCAAASPSSRTTRTSTANPSCAGSTASSS